MDGIDRTIETAITFRLQQYFEYVFFDAIESNFRKSMQFRFATINYES